MTIAACYLSPEGVVFGADSTTTIRLDDGQPHYFNFGQKIFEIGEKATLGMVTWGLGAFPQSSYLQGGFPQTSYRTLFAQFADSIREVPPESVEDAAQRWTAKFSSIYESLVGAQHRAALSDATTDDERTKIEQTAEGLTVGFCLGGTVGPGRRPVACEMIFSPESGKAPTPRSLEMGEAYFWGVPSLIYRMLYGIDPVLFDRIATSPHWKGSSEELMELVRDFSIGQPPMLPLRDAIDWIHSCIQGTIKGLKFSPLQPSCGGPVEIAVVTTDRPFRWVRHKNLAAALEGDGNETHGDAL